MTVEVRKLSSAESIVDTDHRAGASKRRSLLRAMQELVTLITNLSSKFSLPKGAVLDFCKGTGSIGKASMLALKHFNFYLCEANESCLSKDMLSILDVFAREVLNNDLDIIETEETEGAARWYLLEKARAVKSWQKDVWRAYVLFGYSRIISSLCYRYILTAYICFFAESICHALLKQRINALSRLIWFERIYISWVWCL